MHREESGGKKEKGYEIAAEEQRSSATGRDMMSFRARSPKKPSFIHRMIAMTTRESVKKHEQQRDTAVCASKVRGRGMKRMEHSGSELPGGLS